MYNEFGGDDRRRLEVAHIVGRQRALDFATFVDNKCDEDNVIRSPMNVASWNDDRRPPLIWGAVCNQEAQTTSSDVRLQTSNEGECTNSPGYITTDQSLLINAEDYFPDIMNPKFHSF